MEAIDDKRVVEAKRRKEKNLLAELQQLDINVDNLQILFIAIKEAKILEVYVKRKTQKQFRWFKSYLFSTFSGVLGPKKQEGDKQIPEGFYRITHLNPKSKYHLSLGINYPNPYDQAHGFTGSAIFIHGGMESVGCIAIGDDAIEEIYVLTEMAQINGQKDIHVLIYPYAMHADKHKEMLDTTDEATAHFWDRLAIAYRYFQENKVPMAYEFKGNQIEYLT